MLIRYDDTDDTLKLQISSEPPSVAGDPCAGGIPAHLKADRGLPVKVLVQVKRAQCWHKIHKPTETDLAQLERDLLRHKKIRTLL